MFPLAGASFHRRHSNRAQQRATCSGSRVWEAPEGGNGGVEHPRPKDQGGVSEKRPEGNQLLERAQNMSSPLQNPGWDMQAPARMSVGRDIVYIHSRTGHRRVGHNPAIQITFGGGGGKLTLSSSLLPWLGPPRPAKVSASSLPRWVGEGDSWGAIATATRRGWCRASHRRPVFPKPLLSEERGENSNGVT